MTIAEVREICKRKVSRLNGLRENLPKDVRIVGVLIVACVLSFYLGYRSALDVQEGSPVPVADSTTVTDGRYVASRFGTKYYLLSCAGASRISEANRVFFATAEEARGAGYSPAENCAGL